MTRTLWAAVNVAGLGLCLSLEGCATRFQIPSPVPPPVREHAIVAPLGQAREASLRVLTTLGFALAAPDPGQTVVVSEFRPVEGNSPLDRSRGVARIAVERDVYSAGRERLLLNLSPLDAERTQVRLAAEVQAKVERRGEIRYAGPSDARSPLPLFTAWTTAPSKGQGAEWEALTSNGVLEDEFLAALVAELSQTSAGKQ